MKVSIVTVVFNDELRIENTILSVLNQTHNDLEYIVIDGNSSDRTVDIIFKYKNKISRVISEPDKGIYDAMNKGLLLCTGDRVLFLNAGDEFHDNKTIESVTQILNKKERSALIYGNVLLKGKNAILRSQPIKNIHKVMVTNHQGCFFNPEIHKKYLYNIDFKIAADYEVIFKMHVNKEKIEFIDQVISKVEPNGVADSNRFLTCYEYFKVRREYDFIGINVCILIWDFSVIASSYFFKYLRGKK